MATSSSTTLDKGMQFATCLMLQHQTKRTRGVSAIMTGTSVRFKVSIALEFLLQVMSFK